MTVFDGYARYYDLLYQDKDYYGETEFIHKLILAHTSGAHCILELGCGTGVHGIMLAEHGYEVTGIDISKSMLDAAARRHAQQPSSIAERVSFLPGDVRDFELEGQFDVVLALFHVMSYQRSNDDLSKVFERVKTHLAPGGVFIFDCWYGPAVLADLPTVREKSFADDNTAVTRIAVPTLYPNNNWVDVDYQLFVEDLHSESVEELSESHHVRYLFRPELELLAETAGLRLEACGAWMSEKEPDLTTWYVYFVVKHKN